MVLSEISWLSLYCYAIIMSVHTDETTTLTLGFFILGLAGAEFALIYIIVVLLKNFVKSLNMYDADNSINKILWSNINKIINLKN